MATIKQVAEVAGVSKSTVSRFISQKGYVSEEAARRIEQAIKTLNFVPNRSAQSLKTKQNKLVGLLLPDISNPFFPMLAKGAEEFLKEKGYQILLGNLHTDQAIAEDYLNIMRQSNAAGIITTYDFQKHFSGLEIPVVVVDRVGQEAEYGVFSNNRLGGRLAAQEILTAGATATALISAPKEGDNLNERFMASQAYLEDKGASYRAFYSQSYAFEQIQEEARQLLQDFPEVDSIIAPSDIHAIAYIHEILNTGRRIPEDIQIIGYDDIALSRLMYPALSTIHQSSYQLGWEAAQLIYQLANRLPIDQKRIELPVHFVERETLRRKK